jgi:hypothetical protein
VLSLLALLVQKYKYRRSVHACAEHAGAEKFRRMRSANPAVLAMLASEGAAAALRALGWVQQGVAGVAG